MNITTKNIFSGVGVKTTFVNILYDELMKREFVTLADIMCINRKLPKGFYDNNHAVMHRDYQAHMPTRLYQYDDFIEIMNPGGLYGQARPENFPMVNDYRNSVIAEMMKTLNYVNMFNHGVNEVRHLLKANGSPEPEFNVSLVTAFSVIVREPKVEMDLMGGENLPGDTTQKTSNDGVEKSVEKSVEKILKLIKGNPQITVKELTTLIGLSRRGVEKNIKKLQSQNILRRVGPDKGGHWEIVE